MCDEEYIGETSRTFRERYKEHLKEPSPIYGHSNHTGNSTNPNNFTIIRREDHGLARTIKESIYIRVNNSTLNRNVGKYNLLHIWDRVLINTPELRISNHNGHGTPGQGQQTPKEWVIYEFKWPYINCSEEYIGEFGITLRDRHKEHLRAPSPIHSNSTGHPVSPDCFTIVHRESQEKTRNIKEAKYILVNDSSLNRNSGKYQLPHIWDHILQDTPALQLK